MWGPRSLNNIIATFVVAVAVMRPIQAFTFTFVDVQTIGSTRTRTTTTNLRQLQEQGHNVISHAQNNEEVEDDGGVGDSDSSGAFVSRRSAMIASMIAAAQVSFLPVLVASAAMENAPQNIFKTGQPLTMEEAEGRLREGRKSIQYLLDHYDEICDGGGDNVRRYLGTVGMTSGLFGISKVMNTLSDKADDFVEYTEVSNEVLKSIQQADGSAYMAIFVTTSTSQTPPSKYFGDAKIEIKRCIKALDELATLIDVKI